MQIQFKYDSISDRWIQTRLLISQITFVNLCIVMIKCRLGWHCHSLWVCTQAFILAVPSISPVVILGWCCRQTAVYFACKVFQTAAVVVCEGSLQRCDQNFLLSCIHIGPVDWRRFWAECLIPSLICLWWKQSAYTLSRLVIDVSGSPC